LKISAQFHIGVMSWTPPEIEIVSKGM
jgi:hypothetical protein